MKKYINVIPFVLLLLLSVFAILNLGITKTQLFYISPVVMITNILLIIGLTIYCWKDIVAPFRKIDKKVWIIFLLIFIVAFALREVAAPKTHRLYYDEDIYLNIAQNIVNDGTSCLCDYGTTETCYECIDNKQPFGYSSMIAMAFFITGPSEGVATQITIFLSALTVLLIFLMAYLMFKKEEHALFASLIFAFIPTHILWSPTNSAEITFVFFTALAFFGALVYLHEHKYSVFVFSVVSVAFAAQLRPEAPLILLPFVLFFLFFDKDLLPLLRSYKTLFIILVAVLLFLPSAIHTKNNSNSDWGSDGDKFSTNYFNENSRANSLYFIDNTRLPFAFTLLALMGLVYGLWQYMRYTSILILWFMSFFLIYAFFYAGSFNYGVDVRFAMSLFIPFAIISGMGAGLIFEFLEKVFKLKQTIIVALIIIAILISFIQFIPYVSSVGEESHDARTVHDFAVLEMQNLHGCVVFSHVSSMFLVNGVDSLQTFYVQNDQKLNEVFNKYNCTVWYEDYWCINSEPHRNGVCKYVGDNFQLEQLSSTTLYGKDYTFYFIRRGSGNLT